MKTYDKLVRDLIPDILVAKGRVPHTRTLTSEEHAVALDQKLAEELQKYLAGREWQELADLVEVVYAILDARGISMQEFEAHRLAKKRERGGFTQRVFLERVDD